MGLPVVLLIVYGLSNLSQVHAHNHVPKEYKIAHLSMYLANIVVPHSHLDSPVHNDIRHHDLIVLPLHNEHLVNVSAPRLAPYGAPQG